MSSGLMSCVRENSPPLELDMSASGPLSLPEGHHRAHALPATATSTPLGSPVNTAAANGSEANEPNANATSIADPQQQKRRRFHPLRNLRRIFRRRTINSPTENAAAVNTAATACQSVGSCSTLPPPASSEKNLRSPTPSTAQQQQLLTQEHYQSQTQSLPKSKSFGTHRDELLSAILSGKKKGTPTKTSTPPAQQLDCSELHESQTDKMYSSAAATATYQQQHVQQHQQRYSMRQSLGVAVFPDALNRHNFFTDRQQQRSVGDSSQELDSSGNGVGPNGSDMSDSQRSLNEGRLMGGDYSAREALSQSHDSVFSESAATASSLSIVLKAELTDVLRKRRNRPDASDEDLGLPHSPISPQRRIVNTQNRNTMGNTCSPRKGASNAANTAEVSSLSLQSMNSMDGEDHRVSNSSFDILRSHHNEEDTDVDGLQRHRLSHAAAKHKMAIRPINKKGPTRQHRRTLETSIPEANEELLKVSQIQGIKTSSVYDADLRTKTRSLPPGVNAKTFTAPISPTKNVDLENINSIKHIETIKATKHTTSIAVTSTAKSCAAETSATSTPHSFGLKALTSKATNALFESHGESSTDDVVEGNESGFLRRLIHRHSKRSIAKANDGLEEDLDTSQSVAKKLQISTSCLEAASREPLLLATKSRSATSHEQNIQETRQTIKREIHNEGKHGLNAMVSNYGVQPQPMLASPSKPKSGPAARQRYLPQELGSPNNSAARESLSSSSGININSSNKANQEELISITNLLSKTSRDTETFQSTTMVRELQSQAKQAAGKRLSAFQQKLSRSNDSVGQHSNSSNSLETSTDEPSLLYYEEKQRKTVEKSRSFRNYQDEREPTNCAGGVHNSMPSLPDLSISFRVPSSYYNQTTQSPSPQTPLSPISPSTKCVSLGFEINDNKLLRSTPPQTRAESTSQLQLLANQRKGQHTANKLLNATNIMPTLSPAQSTNISEIEQNIDMIVKSPFVSVLRKSVTTSEELSAGISGSEGKKLVQRPKLLELKKTTTSPPTKDTPMTPTSSPQGKAGKPFISSSPPTTPSAKTQTKTSRRNSSSVETVEQIGTGVPEFMKIQLNRVDHAHLTKANHVVLAKNMKPEPTERSQSTDDLSMCCHSGGRSPRAAAKDLTAQQELSKSRQPTSPASIIQQQRAVSANCVRNSYTSNSSTSSGSNGELSTPHSPTKSRPVTGTSNIPKTTGTSNAGSSSPNAPSSPSNRLSLEERRRIFLSEEKTQADRKVAELRYERKKSITEEVQRKPVATTPVEVSPDPIEQTNNNTVVLRKKSFASGNGNVNVSTKEDATPELMKVFARRSLKVKDEDICVNINVATTNGNSMPKKAGGVTGASTAPQQQSMDSDKENQSNSEEKLDRLAPKIEAPVVGESNKSSHTNNRNSVADFRNHNNNQAMAQQKLSYLPPIKANNVRTSANNNNNTNTNNNNIMNGSVKVNTERYSLQLKRGGTNNTVSPTATTAAVGETVTEAVMAASTGTTGTKTSSTPTKAIERSATVGEFKGIHQRRAEWEQRAKEALK